MVGGRWMKYGILALAAAIAATVWWMSRQADIEYGAVLAEEPPRLIAVNDVPVRCSWQAEEMPIPAQFVKAAENEYLELYLEEEQVAIAVRDKCNGYVWFSYDVFRDMEGDGFSPEIIKYIRSGVSLITYDKFTPGRRTVLDPQVKKSVRPLPGGVAVTIDFTLPKIRFDLELILQQGDLVVRVPQQSVQEYDPNLWSPGNNDVSINELIVFPFFGSVTHREDGYIVIPDGAGAIVRLKEKPKYETGYSAPVYGKDAGYENTLPMRQRRWSVKPLEHVYLPIYGMIHEENRTGFLAISESGSSYATYNYVSRGLTTDYYQSYFTYNYRTTYSQFQSRVNEEQHILGFQEKPNQFELVQRYVFLHDDKADYVGVAKKFAELLKKKEGIAKISVPPADSNIPLKIDVINSESALGSLGVEDVSVTTYKQARDMVENLIHRGFDQLNVTFKSFVHGKRSYRFQVMNRLGGKKEFKDTLRFFADNGVEFSFYTDVARTYYDQTKYTASKMSRQLLSVLNQDKFLLQYLNNPKYYSLLAEEDAGEAQQYGVASFALDGLTGSLFTHRDGNAVGYSNESMAYAEHMLASLHERGFKTDLYEPDAYLFQYADNVLAVPIRSSELIFIDATVPLFPLVLSGWKPMYSPYMNFVSDDVEAALKLIEFGVYPSYSLTGESAYRLKYTASNDVYVSEFKYLEQRIDRVYRMVNDVLRHVRGSEMIGHRIVQEGVVEVRYDNGKRIIINYNDAAVHVDGVQIEAKKGVIL